MFIGGYEFGALYVSYCENGAVKVKLFVTRHCYIELDEIYERSFCSMIHNENALISYAFKNMKYGYKNYNAHSNIVNDL